MPLRTTNAGFERMYVFVPTVEPIVGVRFRPLERASLMRAELEKWITDIGAEVRLRAQIASLDARTQRIDDLLKIIAEREISASAAKRVSTR
jgi:hypothetical protein